VPPRRARFTERPPGIDHRLPAAAIIGRPNVGKSALFNRLLARRAAIVEDMPGLTRDRHEAVCEWNGRTFVLIDTGGFVPASEEPLVNLVRRQAERAMAGAELILFVVDASVGLTAPDEEIAAVVRRSPRPVLLVANKADSASAGLTVYEFHALGLGDPIPVSAMHGTGTGDLLDAVVAALPPHVEAPDADAQVVPEVGKPEAREPKRDGMRRSLPAPEGKQTEMPVSIAFLGRPNVGKSSLVNALLGEERVVVDARPGTTRDAIDTVLRYDDRPAVLIDTAGLRRRSRVEESVEFYSTRRTYDAITRADVAVLVIDATEGVTDQDQRIARTAYEAGRAVVIAVNKWDLLSGYTPEQVERVARQRFRFVAAVPVCETSAVRRQGIDALMRAVFRAADARAARIPTGPLNRALERAVAGSAPPTDAGGRSLHIYYATQAETRPPTIVLFVNDPSLLTVEYRRYLERRIRESFDLAGAPIRWALRGRRTSSPERTPIS
jgi:GTPase